MEQRISATELARRLGDFLGRVRYRGESFLVERNGAAVARLGPLSDTSSCSLAEALGAWNSTGKLDPTFADALESVGTRDEPMSDPWGS